jgi:hypothetical protein
LVTNMCSMMTFPLARGSPDTAGSVYELVLFGEYRLTARLVDQQWRKWLTLPGAWHWLNISLTQHKYALDLLHRVGI